MVRLKRRQKRRAKNIDSMTKLPSCISFIIKKTFSGKLCIFGLFICIIRQHEAAPKRIDWRLPIICRFVRPEQRHRCEINAKMKQTIVTNRPKALIIDDQIESVAWLPQYFLGQRRRSVRGYRQSNAINALSLAALRLAPGLPSWS
jgi:hypothetical protein